LDTQNKFQEWNLMENKTDKQRQLEEQFERIDRTLNKMKYRIVVFSGKGGVGKTTVAVNLSYALIENQYRVGLLDADITGPNVPKMIGLKSMPNILNQNSIRPQIQKGLRVISMASLLKEDQPVIWRGPMRSGTIRQFLADVNWGTLDFLLIDLPPGTGDEVITAAQRIRPQMAIVVTTPQDISLVDCRRAVNMAKKLDIKEIGVIENMSGLICPFCQEEIDVFGKGGGEKMAKEMNISFLGHIPLEIAAREGGDQGMPVVLHNNEAVTARAFGHIAEKLVGYFFDEPVPKALESLEI
jgi:Mrp family chromosome partitioning ATPase